MTRSHHIPVAGTRGRAGVATRIMTCLLLRASKTQVADVRIGLGYIAVRLQDCGLGVAFTFRDQAKGGCAAFDGICPLSTRPASDLLVLLESHDLIEVGVGLACANALANQNGKTILDGDILNHLDLRSDDCVGMVGHFAPLVPEIEQRVRSLTIFERVNRPSGSVRPAEEAEEVLPHCQVALITATSIINHTMDGLLRAASNCREVAVLGASTPLLPAAFAHEKVTLLSGVIAEDEGAILRVVSEGGGMRRFRPHMRKVSIKSIKSNKIRER